MHKGPELTRLIHENFWVVLSFAFGQLAVAKLIDAKFEGEWKYLNKTVHEMAEVRADKALLEMATQLRVLDDIESLNDYYKQVKREPLGTVTQGDGETTDLHFRDMTNKVMYSAGFRWNLKDADNPTVICIPHDDARWKEAEIGLVPLMALIGGLMH